MIMYRKVHKDNPDVGFSDVQHCPRAVWDGAKAEVTPLPHSPLSSLFLLRPLFLSLSLSLFLSTLLSLFVFASLSLSSLAYIFFLLLSLSLSRLILSSHSIFLSPCTHTSHLTLSLSSITFLPIPLSLSSYSLYFLLRFLILFIFLSVCIYLCFNLYFLSFLFPSFFFPLSLSIFFVLPSVSFFTLFWLCIPEGLPGPKGILIMKKKNSLTTDPRHSGKATSIHRYQSPKLP